MPDRVRVADPSFVSPTVPASGAEMVAAALAVMFPPAPVRINVLGLVAAIV
mgnify:CR=1 FL=1